MAAPPGMHDVSLPMPGTAGETWDVVADPETYPTWLVGAVEIRSVDEGWPAPGTRFHHRVGLGGPVTTDDSTSVLAVDAPRRLVLEARARPFGRAHVEIEVVPDGPGCSVTMREGMLRPLPQLTPLLQPLIKARNRTSLDRLRGYLEERGAG